MSELKNQELPPLWAEEQHRNHSNLLKAHRELADLITAKIEEVGKLRTELDAKDARITGLERDEEAVLTQRDDAEDALGDAYALVMGRFPEWSNLFGHNEAHNDMEAEIHDLITSKEAALNELKAKDTELAPLKQRVHNDGLLILKFSNEITRLQTELAAKEARIAELEQFKETTIECLRKICDEHGCPADCHPLEFLLEFPRIQKKKLGAAEKSLGAVSEVLKEKLEKYSSSRRVYFYRGPDVDDIFTRARSIVEGK